jgi:hypothetical protein
MLIHSDTGNIYCTEEYNRLIAMRGQATEFEACLACDEICFKDGDLLRHMSTTYVTCDPLKVLKTTLKRR